MLDILTIDNKEFYLRRNPTGFGYEITLKEYLDDNKYRKSLFFHSYILDKASNLYHTMKKTGVVPTELPDTSNETPPLKVVVYKHRDGIAIYRALTKKEYKKVIQKILISEYGYNYQYKRMKPSEPENKSGISSEKELDTIPNNLFEIRQQTKEKWDEYTKDLNRYKIQLDSWKNFVSIIETGDGSYLDVICEYLRDMVELEDVEIVDNE